jgi:AcrR family transcriptional regulator
MSTRTTRANGRASRQQILEAATEIARECGYQGTSISAVSERSGLPKSSIYWHFQNKDDLLAAVIEDDYRRWCDEIGAPHEHSRTESGAFEHLYERLGSFPDFVRLGLMVTLEPPPDGEQVERARFLEIRRDSLERLADTLIATYPHLETKSAAALAAITLALIDGAFVAAKAGERSLTPKALSAAIDRLANAMK